MDSDLDKILQLDLASTQLRLQNVLSTLSQNPNSQELFEEGLTAAHTLKALAAVKGIAHLEQFSAQLEQFFVKAKNLTQFNAPLDIRHLLTPIAKEFNQACELASEMETKNPKFVPSKRLADLVEQVQALSIDTSNQRYQEALQRVEPTTVLLESVFRSFTPWLNRAAAQAGKEIKVDVLLGEAITVPKTSIDMIQTVLVHLLRNAIFHGIEVPSARQSVNKSRRGTIEMSGYLTEHHLTITVSDDGKGMQGELGRPNIVTPDFPTFKEETDDLPTNTIGETSIYAVTNQQTGLGIGLYIVKTCISQVEGIFDLKSIPQMGTSATCHIPLDNIVTWSHD